MIRPSVSAVTAGTQIYGLDVSNLQSDIAVGENEITGTLKHVTEFEGFNPSVPEEQEGNFLALSLTANDGVEITTQLINGTGKEPVTVNDGFCVYRITDNKTQSVKVTFTKDDAVETRTYSLSGLTCEDS